MEVKEPEIKSENETKSFYQKEYYTGFFNVDSTEVGRKNI
jgi:hypothetical protein